MAENVSLGKLLPNITVTVDKNQPEAKSSDELKFSNEWNSSTVFRPSSMIHLPNPKMYFSKNHHVGFSTGLDLIAQEKTGILNKRAERFGLEKNDGTKETITSLYKSMGIPIDVKSSAKMKHVRLDTLHMRGVMDLSEFDVQDYFRVYITSKIEWINDNACNVVFSDETTCARALLGMSKPHPAYTFSKKSEAVKETSEDSTMLAEEKMDVDDSAASNNCDPKVPNPEVTRPEVPVPPGVWRIGVSHPRAKSILFRFATTADKKLPGSEKRSEYYKKYGNPNYGDMKGFISGSKKKKTKSLAIKKFIENASRSLEKPSSRIASQKPDSYVRRPKQVRMRMYADEEELKRQKSRNKDYIPQRRSVHSRLGQKYTKEDLCRLGTYRDYDKEFEFGREIAKPKNIEDLRSKLRKQRRDTAEPSTKYGSKHKGYFKRKHRSPLCMDADDDDDDEDSESSSSGE